VTLFCTEAFVVVIVLMLRRNKSIGGELGGPPVAKYVTGTVLIGLWVFYIVISSLEAYDIIEGF